MNYRNAQKYLLLILLSISGISNAQNNITIKFIGNCGLYLTDGTIDIYTDFPYKSGAYGYMEFEKSELDSIKNNSIFIFTHKHADHYSSKNMSNIKKEKGGVKFTPGKVKKLLKFSKTIPDFDIQVFRTKHRFAIKHNSYLITWHGKKIYLSGDTESAKTIGSISGIDWAFVPPWILDSAKENDIKIDAKMIGVYHLYPSEIASAKEEWNSFKNIRPLVDQGEIITIELN